MFPENHFFNAYTLLFWSTLVVMTITEVVKTDQRFDLFIDKRLRTCLYNTHTCIIDLPSLFGGYQLTLRFKCANSVVDETIFLAEFTVGNITVFYHKWAAQKYCSFSKTNRQMKVSEEIKTKALYESGLNTDTFKKKLFRELLVFVCLVRSYQNKQKQTYRNFFFCWMATHQGIRLANLRMFINKTLPEIKR